jgi:hypothetical protein
MCRPGILDRAIVVVYVVEIPEGAEAEIGTSVMTGGGNKKNTHVCKTQPQGCTNHGLKCRKVCEVESRAGYHLL